MTIRIAHYFNYGGTGGAAGQSRLLCNEFQATDALDVTAIHALDTGAPANTTYPPEETTLDVPLMYATSLEDGIKEVDPDLVFVHGWSADENRRLKALSEEELPDAKFVLRHGVNTFEHWASQPLVKEEGWVSDLITNLGWYDGIICPSMTAHANVSLHYVRMDDPPRTYIIPVGIDPDQYIPTPFKEDGTLRVLISARHAPGNPIVFPVAALRNLVERYPIEARITGAGLGPLTDELQTLVEDKDGIEITGYVDDERMVQHFEKADVVVVPSVSHQAVPTTAVEGMASGNVILTGDFAAAQEEPILNQVKLDHADSWARALEDVFRKDDEAKEDISDGIDRAKDYDIEQLVEEQYVPAFEELVERD